MSLIIVEESIDDLDQYGTVPIAFTVNSQITIRLVNRGLGGFQFVEVSAVPYVKDYDADHDDGPSRWAKLWDISHWAVLAAYSDAKRVGGAVVAWRTDGVDMLDGREDLAVLWDLRVSPEYRRKGVGSALFESAVSWSRDRDLQQLKIETQNINVPACRFYAKQGCELGALNLFAYPDHPARYAAE